MPIHGFPAPELRWPHLGWDSPLGHHPRHRASRDRAGVTPQDSKDLHLLLIQLGAGVAICQ